MRDPMTFEERLADAFDRYLEAAPTRADARTLAAGLARGERGRAAGGRAFWLPRPGGLRLTLVLAALAFAGVAGLLAVGAFLTSRPAPADAGRILAWIASADGKGDAYLVGVDGAVRASREFEGSRGCPTLLGSADAVAIPGFGSVRFSGFDPGLAGQVSTEHPGTDPGTGVGGFERWSPDHRAMVTVGIRSGPVTVVTFPTGDVANPSLTSYRLKYALDAAFSPDGSRLAVMRDTDNTVEIHVLEDGSDTILAAVPTRDPEMTARTMRWAPDGSALVVVTADADGLHLAKVGMDGFVGAIPLRGAFGPGTSLELLAVRGIYAIARTGTGELWELDMVRSEAHDTGVRLPEGVPSVAAMSPSGYGVAVISGSTVRVHWFDRDPHDHVIELPGESAVFSPDGSRVLSLTSEAADDGSGSTARLWVTDPWTPGAPALLSTLPLPDERVRPPDSIPCLQWLPELNP
jgi:hypothetical protein